MNRHEYETEYLNQLEKHGYFENMACCGCGSKYNKKHTGNPKEDYRINYLNYKEGAYDKNNSKRII